LRSHLLKTEIRETCLELQRSACVPLTVSERKIAHFDFRARVATRKHENW
jgi:hypothetical protein